MLTLLCLHGFTGSPMSWDFLGKSTRIAPALLGHSGSSADAEVHRFEDEIDRLAALAVGAGALHVVGYSLGARLALGMASRDALGTRAGVSCSKRVASRRSSMPGRRNRCGRPKRACPTPCARRKTRNA